MNKIKGKITGITSSGNISLVDIDAYGISLSAIILGTSENTPYLVMGKRITVAFKESEVSIGRDITGKISLRNCLEGPIKKLENGTIFSKVTIDFFGEDVQSLITVRSAERLDLKTGDMVTAFIKSNEVILMDIDE